MKHRKTIEKNWIKYLANWNSWGYKRDGEIIHEGDFTIFYFRIRRYYREGRCDKNSPNHIRFTNDKSVTWLLELKELTQLTSLRFTQQSNQR